VLHDSKDQVILVVCFTNYALDEFLKDLLNIGIPPGHMVHLGGKCTDQTKPLTLREQTGTNLNSKQWAEIDKLKQKLQMHETSLKDTFARSLPFCKCSEASSHGIPRVSGGRVTILRSILNTYRRGRNDQSWETRERNRTLLSTRPPDPRGRCRIIAAPPTQRSLRCLENAS
jgi:hypothetical protein